MARKFKTPITLDELGSASSQAIAANVDGDSQNRINIDAGGKITWGSGSATGDTTLYRSAADTLKTDDAFTATSLAVTGQFTLPTSDGSADQVITTNGSGTLTWSDVSANATVSDTAPSSPATGQIWYESDTGKTFVYYDSFWIEVGASPPASPFITDLDEDTKIQVEESADEDKIRFDTAGSERMIIDNTGKVGIGTTSPATGLHVSSGSSIVTVENTNTNSMPSIEMKGIKNTGTAATAAILNARSAGSFTIDVDPDDTDANSASFFSVEVDGAEAMRVDSEGRVGIGTTSPSELLDIDAGTAGSVELTTTGGRTIQLTANDSEPFLSVGSTTAHSAAIMTNGVRRLTVNSSGQVGIGATNPAAELDIKGASNPEIRLQSTDSSDPFLYFGDQVDAVRGGIGMDTSANALLLRGYNNSTRMAIDSSGNVGINDTTPSYTLDVNGDINTTGALRTDGKKTGLVLLTSGDVSSGGPITFTSLFSSEFDNYVVYISELTCTGQNAIYYRTASGGSWNTSSVYSNQRIYGQTTSIGAQRFSSTYANIGYAGARESNYEITFFSPYLSTQTAVISRGAYSDNTNGGFIEFHHSYVDNTTSYDGFVFDEVTGSASISCRYEVYGIPK